MLSVCKLLQTNEKFNSSLKTVKKLSNRKFWDQNIAGFISLS